MTAPTVAKVATFRTAAQTNCSGKPIRILAKAAGKVTASKVHVIGPMEPRYIGMFAAYRAHARAIRSPAPDQSAMVLVMRLPHWRT
jgi:hypothetical protein